MSPRSEPSITPGVRHKGQRRERVGVTDNIDTNKGNKRTLSSDVITPNRNANNRHQVLADTHANGAVEQKLATSDLFDRPDTRQSHDDVDDVRHDGYQEGVADARGLTMALILSLNAL